MQTETFDPKVIKRVKITGATVQWDHAHPAGTPMRITLPDDHSCSLVDDVLEITSPRSSDGIFVPVQGAVNGTMRVEFGKSGVKVSGLDSATVVTISVALADKPGKIEHSV